MTITNHNNVLMEVQYFSIIPIVRHYLMKKTHLISHAALNYSYVAKFTLDIKI